MAKALGAGCWRFSKSSSHPGCRHFGALDKEQIEQVKSTEALQASKDLLAKPAASLLYVSSSGTCGQLDSSQRETSLHAVRDVAERFGWQKARLQRRAPRQGNATGRARAEAVSAGQKSVIFCRAFHPSRPFPTAQVEKFCPRQKVSYGCSRPSSSWHHERLPTCTKRVAVGEGARWEHGELGFLSSCPSSRLSHSPAPRSPAWSLQRMLWFSRLK